ncbi:formate dehydrogenase [Roseospira marina]|uniref:Formate dehydrogenase n=1 Tax=Roseospira marina TaxID=140057 RepID=A0A5M6IB11_9PROT|nr:formate dehydrogenase beta subunit [Roseospira marina]KAA5605484.1 formate dehydrogenase [Roseospira marina]MBB4314513.1 formate dehydrogenase iron-sulfur subunit [Roseospira marina]MBB5088659.1 formate dehydrogenase iron-sulfur subunit [Roseospira marina]
MSTPRVFIPRDAAALSVGADAVASAVRAEAEARDLAVEIVRTGSRGLLWLEPLLEVEGPDGTRYAFGPMTPEAVPELFEAGVPAPDTAHPLALGPTEAIPYLADQHRVTFSRCGIIDPLSVADYRAHGGFAGLDRALTMTAEEICAAVTDSGLRGRGGAGFPAGRKWDTVRTAPGETKYIACNADEGDSGTFADRMLMEGDPFLLIEGITIAGLATGATEGFIYMRSEYPHAITTMRDAVALAEAEGWLGDGIHGTDRRFHLHVRVGAGAYICGEETAMLESLEGRRGQVRAKPPLPALEGLFGKPTVVNNVLTLAAVPDILAFGPDVYATFGVGRSRGTQPFQLAGNVRRGGLVEVPFGISLHDLVYRFGGGTASGRPVKAVQAGGPLGAYLPEHLFHLPKDYEAFAAVGAMVGHGGLVVFDDTVDMAAQTRFALEFCAIESCGKCTPCRIGSQRGVEVIDRIVAGEDRDANLALLDDLCTVLADGSLCAMGGLTPQPVRSALRHFPEDFDRPPHTGTARQAAE